MLIENAESRMPKQIAQETVATMKRVKRSRQQRILKDSYERALKLICAGKRAKMKQFKNPAQRTFQALRIDVNRRV